jgi:hypothetical protein
LNDHTSASLQPPFDRASGRSHRKGATIYLIAFCLLASPLVIAPNKGKAGEDEVRAIAKLFPSDLIIVQTIEDGFPPSDQEFMEALTARLMQAAEQDPELSKKMKGPPPTPEEPASVMANLAQKAGVTEAELARFMALNEATRFEPPTHLVGPRIKFRLVRADGVISFRMVDGSAQDVSDLYVKRANKLLSSLRLKIDGTGAEFRGQPLGAAEWIDYTTKQNGRSRALQWLARDVDAQNLALEIDGQNREVSKIDATVFFKYNEKQKRLFVNMAIWPSGSNATSAEYVILAVGNLPASAAP